MIQVRAGVRDFTRLSTELATHYNNLFSIESDERSALITLAIRDWRESDLAVFDGLQDSGITSSWEVVIDGEQ